MIYYIVIYVTEPRLNHRQKMISIEQAYKNETKAIPAFEFYFRFTKKAVCIQNLKYYFFLSLLQKKVSCNLIQYVKKWQKTL